MSTIVTKRTVGAVLLLLLLPGALLAQENPFFGGDDDRDNGAAPSREREEPLPREEERLPGEEERLPGEREGEEGEPRETAVSEPGPLRRAYAHLVLTITRAQRRLNNELSALIMDVSTARGGAFAWGSVLALAFFYGLLHAVLPGHRKTVLISYYIAEPARLWHGVAVGFTFAAMHVISAIVVVLVAVAGVQVAAGRVVSDVTGAIRAVSSWLIIAIGVLYLVLKVRSWFLQREERESERMSAALDIDDGSSLENHIPRSRPQSIWPAVLSTGIIPCPITTAVLLFAVSLGAVGAGVVAVIALSLGLGVALTGVSVLTIVLKGRVLSLFERGNSRWVVRSVELLGVVAIIGFGLLTLLFGGQL